jgi:hypothetical protein
MQQTHLERPLVLGSQREAGLPEKLSHVRLKSYLVGRLPAAGRPASTNTRFLISPVPAKRCLYSKRSLRPNPPMVWLSLSRKVRPGCSSIFCRSFFSSRSMAFLPSGGVKAVGSRKMSMSSENRWIRFQPFDRLVPPLKITLSPAAAAMMRRASVT